MKIIKLMILVFLGVSSDSYAVSLSDIAYRALSKKLSNDNVPSGGVLNHVTAIKAPKRYMGNIVFLDSGLENVTDDFEEILEREKSYLYAYGD